MTDKGFTENVADIETPNDMGIAEKPLKSKTVTSNRVDINVLKSKLLHFCSSAFRMWSHLHATSSYHVFAGI